MIYMYSGIVTTFPVAISTNDQSTMIDFFNDSNSTIAPALQLRSSGADYGDNSSILEDAPTLTTSASIKAGVLCAMAAIALIGNLATLISIALTKRGTSSSLYTLLFQVIYLNYENLFFDLKL